MLALFISLALVSDPTLDVDPAVFAPGIVSGAAHDSAPAFDPDGKTLYFGRSGAAASFILVSHLRPHGWSRAEIAPFSGAWLDMEPAMAPDGSYLIFSSNRPDAPGGLPVDGEMGGKPQPGEGSHLWRVQRTADGWGDPEVLPAIINSSGSTYSPSIAGDGTLYFMRPSPDTHRFRLYKALLTSGGYHSVETLPFSDGSDTDVDPAVARDQSFMIFGSGRHAKKDIDLFISFHTSAGWSNPMYLGDKINSPSSDAEPRLSPDNKTLYFSSDRVVPVKKPIAKSMRERTLKDLTEWNNGLYNIWFVDLEAVIARIKRQSATEGN